MANEKISAMPDAAALTGAELSPLVQAGANVKATLQVEGAAILNAFGTEDTILTGDTDVYLQASGAGDAYLIAGESGGKGNLVGGDNSSGNGGDARVFAGTSFGGGAGGSIALTAGDGDTGFKGGDVNIAAGEGGNRSGQVNLTANRSTAANIAGGDISIVAGRGSSGAAAGGNIILSLGLGIGAANGQIVINNSTNTPGASAGTLTNAPAVGNPQLWLAVMVDGTQYFIPAWHA